MVRGALYFFVLLLLQFKCLEETLSQRNVIMFDQLLVTQSYIIGNLKFMHNLYLFSEINIVKISILSKMSFKFGNLYSRGARYVMDFEG